MKIKNTALLIVAVVVPACALAPAQQTQINSLVAAVAPLVQDYAQTGQVNYAQAIPVALNSIAIFDPNLPVNTARLASAIENSVSAFTNGNGKSTGRKIASAVLAALPANPTGAQANAALAAAATGASNGANP